MRDSDRFVEPEIELLSAFERLRVVDNMDAAQLSEIIRSSVEGALSAQTAIFEQKLADCERKLASCMSGVPEVEVFR